MLAHAELGFLFGGVETKKFQTRVVSESPIGFGPPVKSLFRARGGLDLNLGRRDVDDLAIADQQPDATTVSTGPQRGTA